MFFRKVEEHFLKLLMLFRMLSISVLKTTCLPFLNVCARLAVMSEGTVFTGLGQPPLNDSLTEQKNQW